MARAVFVRVLLVACVTSSMLVSFVPSGLSRERASSRCPRFNPVAPESPSERSGDVPGIKVLSVRDDMTRDDPLVIEFDFGPALWVPASGGESMAVIEDTRFINLQVDTRQRLVALNAKLVWDSPGQLDDLDVFLYNSQGKELFASNTGTGYPQGPVEMVSTAARDCDGFTVEARPYRTVPRSATLEIWLRERS